MPGTTLGLRDKTMNNTKSLPAGLFMRAQSCPSLCNPMDCSPQAPLSMGFCRQEYWSGEPFPLPGDLPDPGIDPASPAWQANSLPLSQQGSPLPI